MLQPFDFKQWIESHRHLLKPPVGNRRVFPDGDFIIMVVGGPNARSDFHVDPGEEFFYQLEGNMVLKTVQEGRIVDVPIREGEIFLLPANLPHSPQRQANTVGVVIERRRRPGEKDGLQWYCEQLQPQAVRRVLRTDGHRVAVRTGVRALLRQSGAPHLPPLRPGSAGAGKPQVRDVTAAYQQAAQPPR